ncbi:MAG: SMC-Scp complex subunit ScpB [Lachnospiraceae bacterium]|jgi:segregation and condensation protein B|uniref:SMC-Scp complex subunit ScpB n=1 Tax=Clostridium sp. (strain SY8519) TaxID=1042156 RepID=UPI0002171C0A|nr:SMC-Scp complex subunit ScpB [Clostridium sp. SY8519]MCI1654396.1 SMC-Scp complex subunit ScpB [Lachnospiraceae bacterium]MCI1656640.1 SMC-Scp complex subunit ScpB [Lachnospiraceae bacterium]MCI2195352.1 SMC-Scp complex subunit ScpB [Lachnospiraceae bacterium]BAK48296.1 hypothetical protein CXIVA_23290 [Clostridium sp. SY8519]HAD19488.1 SMC-Scp complex subunit ScpB [Lachnospiraceae bacterium]
MNPKECEAAIEAILFSMGDSVSAEALAHAAGISREDVVRVVSGLKDKYSRADSGIQIIELDGSYQLCTKPELYEYLIRIARQPKQQILTDVILETLSIIAYKQPVTRAEIERIRGVSCAHSINKLLEYGLIKELGRLDAPGKPLLFGTTEEFLRCFSVHSTDDLPQISQEKIEEFKEEAAREAQITLDI